MKLAKAGTQKRGSNIGTGAAQRRTTSAGRALESKGNERNRQNLGCGGGKVAWKSKSG